MSPRAIFVMGMGRSGTSNLAGILKALGISLGPEDLMLPPNHANPKGFWEFIPFLQVNDEILRRFGGDWHHPPATMPPGWQYESVLEDLYTRVREVMDRYFSKEDIWAFKDPRTCLTFPFWRRALEGQIDCVFSFRNPLEVALSLQHRDNFPIASSADLWLRNVTESLTTTEGLKRHFMFYEDLFMDFSIELDRLAKFLCIHLTEEKKKAAKLFIEDGLRHNRKSYEELFLTETIPFGVKAAYAILRLFVNRYHRYAEGEMMMVTVLLQHAMKNKFPMAYWKEVARFTLAGRR